MRGTNLNATLPESPTAGPKVTQVALSDALPGMWRDGASDGLCPPASATVPPLLADAPYGDGPGQGFPSHSGRGRNVLFADGRAAFLPVAASNGSADWFDAGTDDAGDIEPLMLFGGR
jgi:prepilin-type processing-associated H-X9-DG protein